MKTIALTVFLGFVFIAPARGIQCVECNDCTNPNLTPKNRTCLTGQDTCMKLDFGKFVYKQCATKFMCSSSEFKNTNANLYELIKNQVGQVATEAELAVNLNGQARRVLSCCQNLDFCNNGMHKTLSIMAVLGMILTYVIV